ncbi:hypothetical protein GCM10011400_55990 [Paraburkholderia caffeinilytica]|uniref:Uncharacterized protein n=1 Tax=Paraburkholderia caffeinilytica TaxID=1761016 RepID=A0ABQ1N9N8_9BURK|nr:hypothetical protein GCM10011400_55990 [Paraburkholderia caffeinilytica]
MWRISTGQGGALTNPLGEKRFELLLFGGRLAQPCRCNGETGEARAARNVLPEEWT